MKPETLDSIDLKILARLQSDARISNVALAAAVGLSPSPCLRRVRALERRKAIRSYVALVDPQAAGLPVSVFVSVTLDKQVEEALEVFEKAIRQRPEVMECYLMTGEADYLLRVVAADLTAYQRFLMDHLTRVPGVANIKSSFALKQVKYSTAIPLSQAEAGNGPGRLRSRGRRPAGSGPAPDITTSARPGGGGHAGRRPPGRVRTPRP